MIVNQKLLQPYLKFYIKNIKLKRTKIFIVGETEIIVFTLENFE